MVKCITICLISTLCIPTVTRADEAADKARNEAIAKAAAQIIIDVAKDPEKYKNAWSKIVSVIDGHHQVYGWTEVEGLTVCVVPLGGGGTRLTQNIDHAPFADGTRNVEFRLLNVRDDHLNKVYWEVKSDVAGRGDGHRQVDDGHKTRHGETIPIDKRAGKDHAYYLAGRWEDGVSQQDFFSANPNGAVMLILR